MGINFCCYRFFCKFVLSLSDIFQAQSTRTLHNLVYPFFCLSPNAVVFLRQVALHPSNPLFS